MFRETYKSAMNDIETNKDLLNSLLEKATPAKKEKFTVIKKFRGYTMSALATAAVVMIAVVSMKGYDSPQEQIVLPKIASENKEMMRMNDFESDAVAETKAVATENLELTKDEYLSYMGIDLEKIDIPKDLKMQETDKISILKNEETGEILNDFHSFDFKGESERYVSIKTEKTNKSDSGWNISASDENYMMASRTKDGSLITVECYMLKSSERNALLNSFNN